MSTAAQHVSEATPAPSEPRVGCVAETEENLRERRRRYRDELQKKRFVSRREEATQQVDLMTRVLRGAGALLLLVSASTFLLQQWESGDDLIRYGYLVAHSGLLVVAALFTGRKLSESRSARMFLWTALAMVPASFGVLGGLVYSQFAMDADLAELPNYAVWVAQSPLQVLLALTGTLLVALPTSWIAARVLARRKTAVVTWSFIGINMLFLVPLRSADFAGLVAGAAAVAALLLERVVFRSEWSLKTLDGRLVRLLFWVPAVMIAARTTLFYPSSLLFVATLLTAVGLGMLLFSRDIELSGDVPAVMDFIGVLAMGTGAGIALYDLGASSVIGPIAFLPVALVFMTAAPFSKARGSVEVVGALVALVVCTGGLLSRGDLLTGATSIVMGIVVVALSILGGRAPLSIFAGLVAVGGVAVVFDRAIGFEHVANWGTLSALGALLVFAAAVAERGRARIHCWIMERFVADELSLRRRAEREEVIISSN